jgi:Xaa-Pro aminopeptidase
MPMLSDTDLAAYRRAQALARQVLDDIRAVIKPGLTDADLTQACRGLMDRGGATGYWWYGSPAVVLSGDGLRLSMEGDVYQPREEKIAADDMITIDVAPELDGYWGDCARSYFLSGGELREAESAGPEQAEGMAMEAALHALLLAEARPDMTFSEMHGRIDAALGAAGFENLDFLGNFGHSVGADVRARAFMDTQCGARLDSVPLLTFEPHIAKPASRFAFKYEEVYLFDDRGRLQVL